MLSGSLAAFSLPDVFALLSATRKTGTLRLRSGRSEGWLEFRDGAVAYAVSDTRRMALASRLLGGGVVDDTQLRHIVAAQRGGAAALSRALLESGAVDEPRFAALVREQIQDAVFELMRSGDGEFSFDVAAPDGGVPDPRSVVLTVGTDELVSEAGRRLRDWEQIAGHVVSPEAVVTLAAHPPAESGTVTIGAEQWRLLTFVDGRRTVRDLVDLTGQGEYATCEVVAHLVHSGLLEVVDPAAGGRTGVAELVARHDLLHRLEERELGDDRRRAVAREAPPAREAARAAGATVMPAPEPVREEPVAEESQPELVPVSELLDDVQPAPEPVADDWTDEDPGPGEIAASALDEPIAYRPEDAADPRPDQPAAGEDTFDREEVERELAALGFRRAALDADDEDGLDVAGPRAARADDGNRGLLHRLMDGRKQA